MPAFGITPSGVFPPASSDGFPRFIQFRVNGVDVGDRSVENLNFTGGVSATVSSDGATVTVDVDSSAPAASFNWFEAPGDYTLTVADADNGLATTNSTGVQQITVPLDADADLSGSSVLVSQEGGAQAEIVAAPGVTLQYRSAAFLPRTAGEFAVLTLIWRAANTWIVCGDLEAL